MTSPTGPRDPDEVLEAHAAALAAAGGPAELFRALLDAGASAAARVAVLLVRQGRLRGWGASGLAPAAEAELRALDLPADSGWSGQALGAESPTLLSPSPLPERGSPPATDCLALPVRAGGRTLAVVLAERVEGAPWRPAALAVLATVAGLRLEIDLLLRRAGPPRPAGDPAPSADAKASSSAATAVPSFPRELAAGRDTAGATRPSLATAPAVESTALEPAPPALAPDPRRDEARRFARLVATDIRLYNEEAVVLGRRHGDLLRRLHEPLARGRESFVRRFGDLGDAGLRVLHEACVQVLAGGDEVLLPFQSGSPRR